MNLIMNAVFVIEQILCIFSLSLFSFQLVCGLLDI